MFSCNKIDIPHCSCNISFSTHPPTHQPPASQPLYDRWGVGGETDESQGAPRHFTFPLLQPDRTWITVNDSPPRPQSDLTCHRLSSPCSSSSPSHLHPNGSPMGGQAPLGCHRQRGTVSFRKEGWRWEDWEGGPGIGCRSVCHKHTDISCTEEQQI